MDAHPITFGGQTFQMLADRALAWPARRTLILADAHFGKGSVFRDHGVPVPSGATARDLARIDRLLESTDSTRLLILGDFFHGKVSADDTMIDQISRWRGERAELNITLVRGNHDRSAGEPAAGWGVEVVDSLVESDLHFLHVPPTNAETPTLAGHVHPCARLEDFDSSSLRVPCFVVEMNLIILPAFGSLTGHFVVPPGGGRRLYLAAGGRVLPWAGRRG